MRASAVFRRSGYQQVGPWDPELAAGPDREFWMRLGTIGRIDFLPQTLALYRETKRIETERLCRIIPPAEYDWYL